MHVSETASLLLLAGSTVGVAVARSTPTVPISSQVGALNFGVTCKLPLLGSYAFAGYFTATAPIQGRSGSEIYYTNVTAAITIPKAITTWGRFTGSKSASANVRLSLHLANASPEVLHVFPDGLQLDNIAFTPGQELTVQVPTEGTLPPIGPVTLGEPDQDHAVHLGDVGLSLTIGVGDKQFGPLKISCAPSDIKYRIGTVNVLPSSDTAPAEEFPSQPLVKTKPVFAEIENGMQTGTFSFPYSCSFGDWQQDVQTTITGSAPTYLNHGQVFNVAGGHASFRFPSDFAAHAQQIFPSVASGRMVFDEFQIGVVNGEPASVNSLTQKEIAEFAFEDGETIEVSAPKNEKLKIGPITAGSLGAELFLASGIASGQIDFLDSSKEVLASVDFECQPKYQSVLLGIPLSDLTADPIGAVKKKKKKNPPVGGYPKQEARSKKPRTKSKEKEQLNKGKDEL